MIGDYKPFWFVFYHAMVYSIFLIFTKQQGIIWMLRQCSTSHSVFLTNGEILNWMSNMK